MTPATPCSGLALLVGGLWLGGCLGDDLPDQGGEGSTWIELTSTTGMPLPGTTTATPTSGDEPEGSSGPPPPATGSTSDPTGDEASGTSAGTSEGSSSGDSGETGTGEQGYGDCFNGAAGDACLATETCIDDAQSPPGVAVCAVQGCMGAGECPSPPPGGEATPACMDVTGDAVDECVLACGGGASCPTGMLCYADFVCVWGGGIGPGDFTCVDEDLGVATGNAVASGSTMGQGNDFAPGCVMSNAPDVQLVWTALAGGTYTFDTVGSTYDTVLYVREDCVGPELACNDDTVMTQSQVVVDLAGGQSVMIVIDGWNNASGSYVLNIH